MSMLGGEILKKVFLFLTFMGIFLGLIFGIRSAIKNISKEEEEIIQEDSGDNVVHELNIPIMEIDSLNPIVTNNIQVASILGLIYEPLVKLNKSEELIPILATEWAQKDDLNWIVKLRKDVKWHNDSSFTANDVIFTIDALRDENLNSIYKSNISNILNVEALDEYSLNITLLQKHDFFIYKLVFPIIPEYYFKNGGSFDENKNNIPVGTGPYKYSTTDYIENYIKLEINDNWWNSSNNNRLKSIYLYKYPTYGEAIKAYKSAKVDLIVTSMSDWAKKFGTIGNNIYRFESSIYDTLVPNTSKFLLSDSSVRKAILYAINRENIVSKVFESNATVTDIPIHTRSNNYLTGLQSDYSLDKAKQVLINAGWINEDGMWKKDGAKLRFTLLVNESNFEQLKSAEIIKDNLNDMDIELIIKKVNWLNLIDALNSDNFDLALISLDIKNELTLLDFIASDSASNYANYSSEKMDEAINNIKNNYNAETMRDLQRIYKDETPYIGLYFRNNTLLTNKSVKGSLEPIWNNPYENITTWCK